MLSKLALGALALTTVAGGGAAATQAATQQKVHRGVGEHPRPQMEEMIQTFENQDFESWQAIITEREGPMAEFATEAVFEDMLEIHALHEAGDLDGAKEAREALHDSLGIEAPQKQKKHQRGERGERFDAEVHESMKAAVDAGDFDTWKSILTEAGVDEARITEDRFDRMVEFHENTPDSERQQHERRGGGSRSIES